jgi:hypothetical protein
MIYRQVIYKTVSNLSSGDKKAFIANWNRIDGIATLIL